MTLDREKYLNSFMYCNEDYCTVLAKDCKTVTENYGTPDDFIAIDVPMCNEHIKLNQERIRNQNG